MNTSLLVSHTMTDAPRFDRPSRWYPRLRNRCLLASLVVLTTSHSLSAQSATVAPITGQERVQWAVISTVGLRSLAGAGVMSAGWGTWRETPPEYDSDWGGFAQRYGMRLTGVSVGNAVEASLGTVWGEDPRYFRAGRGSFFSRVGRAAKLSVVARRSDGRMAPSYARYVGLVGNNFLSNAWRVESESSVGDAWKRSALGLSGKFTSNLFEEFWPDIIGRGNRGK